MTRDRVRQAVNEAKGQGRRQRMLGVRMTDAELGRLNKVARKEGIAGATLARALILAGLDDLEGKA